MCSHRESHEELWAPTGISGQEESPQSCDLSSEKIKTPIIPSCDSYMARFETELVHDKYVYIIAFHPDNAFFEHNLMLILNILQLQD